ncbi:intraflagellar transport complex B protein 46 C terminal-domain-containing protein [Phlyctochytrium arcticum]|nr:intraflagellar transport complex B protein 46 C terminal-domain-containing protein [Phlyctochytrium arcticum]
MSIIDSEADNGESKLQVSQVKNNYYDEIVALSDSELQEYPTPTENLSVDLESGPSKSENDQMRGDSPPSANLTESEEEYDQDEDDTSQIGLERTAATHGGRPSAAPAGRSVIALGSTGESNRISLRADASPAGLTDDDDQEIGHDDFFGGGVGAGRQSSTKFANSSAYKNMPGDDELQELFQYVQRYTAQDIDLETQLKPFIPDFVPAIGDIDAFIKIPRPDDTPDHLGLASLDEPTVEQSDPTVLDLRLRAISKFAAPANMTIRSMDSATLANNPKAIDGWIKNIRDLHTHKPMQTVHYSKRMPDIEELMQVWPEEIEAGLENLELPSADLDLPLPQLAQLLTLFLGIPIAGPNASSTQKGQSSKPAPKQGSTHTIEALHVLFTLFSEFNNSQHFKPIDNSAS